MSVPQELKPKHHEILNLYFLGRNFRQISEMVGMAPSAICCIIKSPLAQAELSRMTQLAKDSVTNVPLRARLSEQLDRSASKGLNVIEGILDNPMVDIKVRARASQHILDRVVFEKDDNEREGSYRDILRKLNEMSGTMMIKPQPIVIESELRDSNFNVTELESNDNSDILYGESSLIPHSNGDSKVKLLLDEED